MSEAIGVLPTRTTDAPRPLLARVFRKALANSLVTLVRAIVGGEARWEGCAPAATQRIYVSNHTSHADFLLVWAAMPARIRERTRPVAAGDYWQEGAIRRYLAKQVFRSVLVERHPSGASRNPIAPMMRAFDAGNSLILFPEGTRGSGESLLPFKCGIYRLALEYPEVELVPVWIDNSYRVLPKGALVPAPLLCSVTFGTPTRLLPGEDKHAFLARLREVVAGTGKLCNTTRS